MPPAGVADPPLTDHTAYVVSQVGRASRRLVTRRLAARDLTMQDMAALAVLDQAGAVPQSELGRRVGLDPSDVTALVDRMCAAGRVERTVDPDDRRRRLVRTTRTGTAALRAARRITDQVGDDLLAPLAPELRPAVHAALLAVLEHARTLS